MLQPLLVHKAEETFLKVTVHGHEQLLKNKDSHTYLGSKLPTANAWTLMFNIVTAQHKLGTNRFARFRMAEDHYLPSTDDCGRLHDGRAPKTPSSRHQAPQSNPQAASPPVPATPPERAIQASLHKLLNDRDPPSVEAGPDIVTNDQARKQLQRRCEGLENFASCTVRNRRAWSTLLRKLLSLAHTVS